MIIDTNNRIHVALSPWDLTVDYNSHAGVTLLSLLEHSVKPVTVHILYDQRRCIGKEKETAYHKSCYQKIADRFGCILEYHHIEVPDWAEHIPSMSKKWTPGALLRLHLAEILPPQVNKIIYFDCDMVITTSVDSLWDIELYDTYLGACLDTDIPVFSRRRKRMYHAIDIPISTYFCSGTMILNLKKLREDSGPFAKTIYQFLQRNPNLPFLDQDMLNWYCNGNYTRLPEKYNVYSGRFSSDKYSEGAVIHYASLAKPWNIYSGDVDFYYWEYARNTPWLENRKDFMLVLLSVIDIKIAQPYLQKNLVGLLNGTRLNKIKSILKFIGGIIVSCFENLIQK